MNLAKSCSEIGRVNQFCAATNRFSETNQPINIQQT